MTFRRIAITLSAVAVFALCAWGLTLATIALSRDSTDARQSPGESTRSPSPDAVVEATPTDALDGAYRDGLDCLQDAMNEVLERPADTGLEGALNAEVGICGDFRPLDEQQERVYMRGVAEVEELWLSRIESGCATVAQVTEVLESEAGTEDLVMCSDFS